MYLHEIFLQNTGPISECHVKPPFDDAGNPQPIVIVGPNGSGKTIFLSYIVDALFEFAKRAFRDIGTPDSSGGTPYLRDIHPRAIRSGERFSLSLLRFKVEKYMNVNETDLYYCEKSGHLDPDSYSPDVKSVFAPVWNWELKIFFLQIFFKIASTLKFLQKTADLLHTLINQNFATGSVNNRPLITLPSSIVW